MELSPEETTITNNELYNLLTNISSRIDDLEKKYNNNKLLDYIFETLFVLIASILIIILWNI